MKREIKYDITEELEKDLSSFPYRTVCSVVREAYKINDGLLRACRFGDTKHHETIAELLKEAYDLQKRMDRKLKEYNNRYHPEVFEGKE